MIYDVHGYANEAGAQNLTNVQVSKALDRSLVKDGRRLFFRRNGLVCLRQQILHHAELLHDRLGHVVPVLDERGRIRTVLEILMAPHTHPYVCCMHTI